MKNSPLHAACTNPQIDRSIPDTPQNPLGSAKKANYSEHKESCKIVIFLLKNNADVHAKNAFDNTPLHAACIEGLQDCAEALLDAGADLTQATGSASNNSTPLHLAAEYSHAALTEFLLERGADASATNSMGKNCLEVAMETVISLGKVHRDQTIEVLCEHMGQAVPGSAGDGAGGAEDGLAANDVDATAVGSPSSSGGSGTAGDGDGVGDGDPDQPRVSEDMGAAQAAAVADRAKQVAAEKKKMMKKKKPSGSGDSAGDTQQSGCGKCVVS